MDSTQTTKIDVYQMVTDRIIALLEAGTVPWQKPWTEAGTPMNLLSKRPYRGINFWLLYSLNYEHNLFLTWEQLKSIGGSVQRGEKGHIIVFWSNVPKKPEEKDEQGNLKTVPMLRYYKVFNIAQCLDIREDMLPLRDTENPEPRLLDECEHIVDRMPQKPKIAHIGKQPCYHISDDKVCMPLKKSFRPLEAYYATLFHELTHSTGAEKRLNRKTLTEMAPFGSPSYSMEELIAEMGSAFLCHHAGILPSQIADITGYIDNWLSVFRKEKRFLLHAASQAQKAADFILNRLEKKQSDEVEEVVDESVIQ